MDLLTRWGALLLLGGLVSDLPAAECRVEPLPPPDRSSMFDDEGRFVRKTPPTAMVYVRGATEDKPFTLEFAAVGDVLVGWRRNSIGQPTRFRQRIEIQKQSLSSIEFLETCRLDWRPTTQLLDFDQLRLSGESDRIIRWRVLVFERNETPALTVLDEDLSFMFVSGAGLDTNVTTSLALPRFDFLSPPADHVAAKCATAAGIPRDAVPERLISLPASALDSPATIRVFSGRDVFARARGVISAPVMVHVAAKPPGAASPAVPICTTELAPGSNPSTWIVASLPWELGEQNMRWEFTLDSRGTGPAIALEIYSDRPPVTPHGGDRVRMRAYAHAVDAYSCAASSHKARVDSIDLGAQFAGAYALTVRTGLEGLAVTEDAREEIHRALVNAVTLWRNSCASCSPYQFSVVALDEHVFVPHTMLRGTPDNYRASFANHPWSDRVAATQRVGPRMSFDTVFTQIRHTYRQRRRFCNQSPELNRFSAPDSPLCRPTTVSGENEMLVNIVWDDSALPCGGKKGVVACWDGSDLVRMNLSEFSFYAGDIEHVLVGTSPRRVDLTRVFGHEVGHWLGLPHLSGTSNLMSDNYTDAKCVSDNVVRLLDEIAVGSVPPFTSPEALRYARD